jgi:hypothetical protein
MRQMGIARVAGGGDAQLRIALRNITREEILTGTSTITMGTWCPGDFVT